MSEGHGRVQVRRKRVQRLKPSDYSSSATQFIRHQDWAAWWEEFATKTAESGALVYPTAWAFARAKGQSRDEQEWIYAAIGPEPKRDNDKPPLVPWLGNWQVRREDGFWPGTEHVNAIAKVLAEHADAIQVARRLGELDLRWLRRFDAWLDQIDAHFGGLLFRAELKFEENKRRADYYVSIMAEVFELYRRAKQGVLECFGVNLARGDLNVLVNAIAVQANSKTQRALEATQPEVAGAIRPEEQPFAMRVLASYARKAKMFGMPLPVEVYSCDDRPATALGETEPSTRERSESASRATR